MKHHGARHPRLARVFLDQPVFCVDLNVWPSRRDPASKAKLSATRIVGCLAIPLTRAVTLLVGKVSHACPVVSCSSPTVWVQRTSVHIRCSPLDHMIRSDG